MINGVVLLSIAVLWFKLETYHHTIYHQTYHHTINLLKVHFYNIQKCKFCIVGLKKTLNAKKKANTSQSQNWKLTKTTKAFFIIFTSCNVCHSKNLGLLLLRMNQAVYHPRPCLRFWLHYLVRLDHHDG